MLALLVAACGAVVVAALLFFAWQSFYPVQASNGWSYRVMYNNVQRAASILPMADGSLLVSQELQDGKGSILRIAADGSRKVVLAELSKPDGITPAQGGWVFSQEVDNKGVSLVRDGKVVDLFSGSGVQGLLDDGKDLYAIEDRKGNGRLLRYRWSDQQLTVLRDNLSEAEALTRCSDGRVLYSEKERGLVYQLSDGPSDPVVLRDLSKPAFMLCDNRGLWISEDSTHRASLLLVGADGQRQTVLSFLKAPQSVVATDHGTYLVAEGGRNRVLEITPPDLDETHHDIDKLLNQRDSHGDGLQDHMSEVLTPQG
ncbi:hypothetical protein [Pseudomonas sp. 5P_3.1_Bac2]|uniref:hypothetical protein n=1 Tax=Pseudomonas sp. 5P_3.1_Bac2 TaxID=2971617 RepID=UPI0021CA2FC9|nr:hypothetical protein [Pseudomonas sp. 5P_3.1_Bac2]MCU1718275.1 hypothetical protein [Pseudomonas sp. 5P_3.1_Bac2]